MKRSVHFSIPEPCHENWDQMTPNEQGRFCGACQKTVIDFSAMADQELLTYLSKATSMLCGNFAPDQLNRPMVDETARRSYGFRYFWSALVSGFLLLSQGVSGQVRKSKTEGYTQAVIERDLQRFSYDTVWRQRLTDALRSRLNAKSRQMDGVVTDSRTKLPVAHASITIPGLGTVAAANEAGAFTLSDMTFKDSVVLEISAVGYDKKVFTVKMNDATPVELMLAPASAQLDTVSVIAYGSRTVRGAYGMIIKNYTVGDQLHRAIADFWPGKKSVTVYPNPATAGGSVKIEMNIKATGEYKLELLDASGRLVHVQALTVTQPTQVVSLPIQSAWSKGIYWIRISSMADKKIYHAKLLLQ